MRQRALLGGLLGALLASGCAKSNDNAEKRAADTAAPTTSAGLDLHDPASCMACHPTIHAEFSQSMHARSHQARDPIYKGVRALRIKKEGAAIATACERCHTPDSAAKPNLRAGVTCFACHNLRVNAAPGTFIGPHSLKPDASAVHKMAPTTAAFKDGRTLCLGCHDVLAAPSGVAMCSTGTEHARISGVGGKTCVDCHMPRIKGPGTFGKARPDHASHAFLGPHRAWYQNDASFVATGVKLSANLERGALTISISNQAGHDFPTGFPGRVVELTCRGVNATGAAVWNCAPIRFGKIYVDAAGKPTLAPFATKLASDTRLPAGATRTFKQQPPAAVTRVELELVMRLLPMPLAKKLGLAGTLEAQPRTIVKLRTP